MVCQTNQIIQDTKKIGLTLLIFSSCSTEYESVFCGIFLNVFYLNAMNKSLTLFWTAQWSDIKLTSKIDQSASDSFIFVL